MAGGKMIFGSPERGTPDRDAFMSEMSEPTASPAPLSLPCDVFLSYRHVDPDRAFARDLLGRLEAAGFRVAIDERDFRPEATFLEEMERCIQESRFTLAVLSPRYVESGNTMEEAIIS